MKGMLEYSPGNTLLHKINPVIKLLMAFILCVACFLNKSIPFALAMIGLNLVMAAYAGIGKRALSMLKTLLKLGIFLFVLQILFIRSGNVLLGLPLGLIITDKGLAFSVLLVLRLIGATMPLALLLSLTRLGDLTGALVQQLRIPYRYAFALTTAIRFIPVFSHEMSAIIEAQTARGVEFDTKNPMKKLRLVLPLCVPLLVSSVKKCESAAISAELRGFNNREKTVGYHSFPVSFADLAAVGACVVLLAAGFLL